MGDAAERLLHHVSDARTIHRCRKLMARDAQVTPRLVLCSSRCTAVESDPAGQGSIVDTHGSREVSQAGAGTPLAKPICPKWRRVSTAIWL